MNQKQWKQSSLGDPLSEVFELMRCFTSFESAQDVFRDRRIGLQPPFGGRRHQPMTVVWLQACSQTWWMSAAIRTQSLSKQWIVCTISELRGLCAEEAWPELLWWVFPRAHNLSRTSFVSTWSRPAQDFRWPQTRSSRARWPTACVVCCSPQQAQTRNGRLAH